VTENGSALISPELNKCWKRSRLDSDEVCEKLQEFGNCRNCPDFSLAARSLLDRPFPDGLLDDWSERLSGAKDSSISNEMSVVVFRIRDEWLALDTHFLQEVAETRMIHTVPARTNSLFLGLVNVNGELLPCMSSVEILGLTENLVSHPEGKQAYRRMIAVQKENNRFVFQVDEVLCVSQVSRDVMEPLPDTLMSNDTALMTRLFYLEGATVGLLDAERFFQALTRSLPS